MPQLFFVLNQMLVKLLNAFLRQLCCLSNSCSIRAVEIAACFIRLRRTVRLLPEQQRCCCIHTQAAFNSAVSSKKIDEFT